MYNFGNLYKKIYVPKKLYISLDTLINIVSSFFTFIESVE